MMPLRSHEKAEETGRVRFILKQGWFSSKLVAQIEVRHSCLQNYFDGRGDNKVTRLVWRDVAVEDLSNYRFFAELKC